MHTHPRRHSVCHAPHSKDKGSVHQRERLTEAADVLWTTGQQWKNCKGQRASHDAQPRKAVVRGKEVLLPFSKCFHSPQAGKQRQHVCRLQALIQTALGLGSKCQPLSYYQQLCDTRYSNAHTFKKFFQCHIGKSSPRINYLQKYAFVWSWYLLVIIGSDGLKLSITLQIFSGNKEN